MNRDVQSELVWYKQPVNLSSESLEKIKPENIPVSRGIPILLLSVFILILGNNLQGTLLGIRAGIEGMSSVSIGLMMSSYYGGFVLGSLFLPRLISSVGHIRTYAALASMASAVTLAYVLIIFIPVWVIFRFMQGLCYSGMILVIESWLNGCTTRGNRGQVLATYGVVFWGSAAFSQTLLNIAPPSSFFLFGLISILLSIAMVPITLAPSRTPSAVLKERLKIRRLHHISPLGMLGVLVSGICIGAVWGMGPVFADNIKLSPRDISFFMTAIMAGALISQWPLGKLSDKMDRRYVIVGSCLIAGIMGIVFAIQQSYTFSLLIGLALVFGGLSFPLYSLSVAHVNDWVHEEECVGTASTLILLQGLGSAAGPMLAGFFMGIWGPQGLFYFVGGVLLILAVYGLYHTALQRRPAIAKIKRSFMAVPRVSFVFLHEHSKRKKKKEKKVCS
ncbi:MAG: MFS transporter [Chitinispirillaceae bacterium]